MNNDIGIEKGVTSGSEYQWNYYGNFPFGERLNTPKI